MNVGRAASAVLPTSPHEFAELRNATRHQAIILGTGLSAGWLPPPYRLLELIKAPTEAQLGCGPIDNLPDNNSALYEWAEIVLNRIAGAAGPPPKLRLADAMGLLNDRKWAVDVDLNGALDRHRVIARFAREELWGSIWSLNWDCMLESALENVGFVRGGASRNQPWLTTYSTIVIDEDLAHIRDRDVLCVLKPHGCAHALANAQRALASGQNALAEEISARFMITQSELREARGSPVDRKFFTRFISDLESNPILVAGWSVSEPYIIAAIDKVKEYIGTKKREDLSIIDLKFNDTGHAAIAACFKLSQADVFFPVTDIDGIFDIDDLFLWLQAKYCLDRLINAADPVTKGIVTAISTAWQAFTSDAFLIDWADKFVPAWTRFCWRGNLVDCQGYQSHKLAVSRRHEHIPWRLPKNIKRPDLASAAKLLAAVAPRKAELRLDAAQGALFFNSGGRLVVPIPAWGELNALAAIKPLIETFDLSAVQRVDALPLHPTEELAALQPELVASLVQSLANVMPVPQFADPGNIGIADDMGT